MALEKDLDEILFFFFLSLLLFCPWLGKEETLYHCTDLIGAGHVTRDLGDSVSAQNIPCLLSHDGLTLSFVIYALRGRAGR